MSKLLHTLVLAVLLTIVMATPAEVAPWAYKAPQWYHTSTCQKPPRLTFYTWMGQLVVPPYEAGVFDCSQRVAYIEWLSESCNHTTVIAGGDFEGYAHLWVLIDVDGESLAYEARDSESNYTNPWIARETTHFHYHPNTVWRSVFNAPLSYDYFDEEFAWWVTHPSLIKSTWEF